MKNAYVNGVFCNTSRAYLSIHNRSLLFGDGVYDAVIARKGHIFMPNEHINRFFNSARNIGMESSMSESEILAVLEQLAAFNAAECVFLYFQLSRTYHKRRHSANGCKVSFFATAAPIEPPNPEKHLHLITAKDLRYSICHIKTVNLLPSVLAATEADAKGADEAILVRNGTVTECAHSNIHIIKSGSIITHPLNRYILPGISRLHLIRTAANQGIPFIERPFTLAELYNADSVIITSTSRIAQTAAIIDNVQFDTDNPIAKALVSAMHQDFYKATV